jgi:hypothetical protein
LKHARCRNETFYKIFVLINSAQNYLMHINYDILVLPCSIPKVLGSALSEWKFVGMQLTSLEVLFLMDFAYFPVVKRLELQGAQRSSCEPLANFLANYLSPLLLVWKISNYTRYTSIKLSVHPYINTVFSGV